MDAGDVVDVSAGCLQMLQKVDLSKWVQIKQRFFIEGLKGHSCCADRVFGSWEQQAQSSCYFGRLSARGRTEMEVVYMLVIRDRSREMTLELSEVTLIENISWGTVLRSASTPAMGLYEQAINQTKSDCYASG